MRSFGALEMPAALESKRHYRFGKYTAMEITAFPIRLLTPPKDDLLSNIKASPLTLEEGDVIALSSKAVSIWQGRCAPRDRAKKEELIKQEADRYLEREHVPGEAVIHTIRDNVLIPSSGIDPFGKFYILPVEKPQEAALALLSWFQKEYGREKLYLVITDSRSAPLRRGVVGIAVGWAGFEPLYDGRNRKDLLGEESGGSQTNLADAIAATAVLQMGEANEGTPLVRLRGVPYVGESRVSGDTRFNTYEIPPEEDIYFPFLKSQDWKKGGHHS
jgi:F420-0:gamma-glutamyl ligase